MSDGVGVREPVVEGESVFSGGNEVTLLSGGDELFPAMQAAIAAAHHEVWLATYIFYHDDAARAMAYALVAAARRGVPRRRSRCR